MLYLASSTLTDILYVSGITIFSVAIILLLIKSIKKEKVNFLESQSQEKNNKIDIKKFIQKRIESAGKKTIFTIFRVDIHDYESLENNFGKIQIGNLKSELFKRLSLYMPESMQFLYEDYSLMLYVKDSFGNNQLDNYVKLMVAESQKSFVLAGSLRVNIDVNISVVSYPESGKNYNDFMHNLDLAMMYAKRKGINTYKIYDKQLSNEDTEEYKYYKEIKEAISNRDFELYYQPIVELKDKAIIGAESLLRWNHKTMGVLPPSKFLNIMEHSGDIYWVGLWAFEQLVKQLLQTKIKFPDKKILFSMNLSPKQLLNPELVNELKRLLIKHKAEAGDFCMEIIEFAMFDKVDIIQNNILRLRQLGFKIAIDNYGLEFSTMSLIDNLSIDVIKLNKTFTDKTDGSFTKNIIEMLNKHSTEKKMMIIAEGIEDEAAYEKIKDLKISYGQGYYFSKPKAYDDLIQFIKNSDN